MNSLVDEVNSQLALAVGRASRANKSIMFIDYDRFFSQVQGRYCEPDVDESKRPAAQRTGLLFYEFSTRDPSWGIPQEFPWKRQQLNGSLPENNTNTGEYENRAAIFDAEIRNTIAKSPELRLDPSVVGQEMYDHYHGDQKGSSLFTPVCVFFRSQVILGRYRDQQLIKSPLFRRFLIHSRKSFIPSRQAIL